MDSLRERTGHSAKAPPSPLLPQTAAGPPPYLNGKRRPASPPGHRGAGQQDCRARSRLGSAARLLASRRFLASVLALTLVLNVAMRLPASWRSSAPEFSDPAALSGDATSAVAAARAAAAGSGGAGGDSAKLIPRVLHQTYATSSALTPVARQRMQTWRTLNPGWEFRYYDDQACLDFVRREYPQYLEAYRRLDKPVERSDLFRYLVVLRHGGVYADVDAECHAPLDGLITSSDTLLAGWEADFATPEAALDAWFVRSRQLAQWAFAAAAGHPALLEAAERTASAVQARTLFSTDPALDTAERTGAGLFTDVVLAHAAAHPPSNRDDPWGVRLLPRVAFGAPARGPGAWGLTPLDPGVVALHPTRGAWRRARQHARRWLPWPLWSGGSGSSSSSSSADEDASSDAAANWERPSKEARAAQLARMRAADAAHRLYPVSAAFQPAFDVLTHRAGGGEQRAGQDVGAALTRHGSWQPSVQPQRRPTLADAVVGSLGSSSSGSSNGAAGRLTLVDVGAGYGLLSLAAAARGHRAVAFELGPQAAEALEAAVARNGFGHLVQLRQLPLGAPQQQGYVCLEPRPGSSAASLPAALRADMARGYATPAAHATPAEGCRRLARRTPGAAAVGSEEQVGAIRISANGWEGWVLEGFAPLIERQRPPVVALEWSPAAMRAAGYLQPLHLLQWLYDLGYTEASHSGFVCDERWYSVTYGVRRRGGASPEELAALRQPTWCRLEPEHWPLLLDRGGSAVANPETLLLINRAAGNGTSSAAGSSGGSGNAGLGAAAQQQGGGGAAVGVGGVSAGGSSSSGGGGSSGGSSEDAELEASVAATLAALAHVEQAFLRPGAALPQRQEEQPAASSKATAGPAAAGGGGGRSSTGVSQPHAGGSMQKAATALAQAAVPPLAQQQQQPSHERHRSSSRQAEQAMPAADVPQQ